MGLDLVAQDLRQLGLENCPVKKFLLISYFDLLCFSLNPLSLSSHHAPL